ncbi:hypothetical protein GCM10009801_75540 [Streptomyces albiaxialis]|uniref:DUF4333 domain-containing protein n=2 Tax=Streptomyces albiaxialis TaxID=329523 RepID=A0ABP5INZ2_9ACTN
MGVHCQRRAVMIEATDGRGLMRSFIRIPVALSVTALALTACSVGSGSSNSSVATPELEKQVNQALTQKVGQSPKKVDCPDELEAEKGAETRCTLTTPEGPRYGVTVTVSSVQSGKKANFDIKVDEKPQ